VLALVEVVVEVDCKEVDYSQDHIHTQEYHTQAGTGCYAGIQVCSLGDKEVEVEVLLSVCIGHTD